MIAAVTKTKKERDLIFEYIEHRKRQQSLFFKLKTFSTSESESESSETQGIKKKKLISLINFLESKLWSLFSFILIIFEALIDWTTAFLNRRSRE